MPWWVQLIIAIISYYVQSQQQKKAAQRAKQQQEEAQRQADLMAAQARGVLLNLESNDSPVPVVYGRRRVGGITVLKETAGSNNNDLHKVVVLSEGPVQGAMNYYLDSVLNTNTRYAGVQTMESRNGAHDQAASAALIAALPTKWTAAHRGRGLADVYGKFTWNESAWQGEPTITVDLHGRICYDPRDGGTRFTNNPPLCIRDYLTNTIYGRGIAEASIDDDAIIEEANFCDERVDVPRTQVSVAVIAATDTLVFPAPTIIGLGDGVAFEGAAPGGVVGGSPTQKYYYIPITANTGKLAASYADALAYTGTESPSVCVDITSGDGSPDFVLTHIDQARHQLDGTVDVEVTPLDNVAIMQSACRGDLIYTAGRYKLKCDKPEAASGFVFNEHNIIGGWRIALPMRRERLNRVTARFINPARDWQPDLQVFDSPTYRTADNGLVLETELNMQLTTNVYRAQREAQLVARLSRLGIRVQFRATVDAFRCEIGDVVAVDHDTPGWDMKLFRVDALEMRPDDEVDVSLSEYDAGAYNLDPLSEVRTAPLTNLPNPFDNLDITGLVAMSGTAQLFRQGDGTIVPRVQLTWDQPANPFIRFYELQFATVASPTEWVPAPNIPAPATSVFFGGVNDGDIYDFRLRAVTSLGNTSREWATVLGHTVIGKTEVPSDVTGAVAYQNGDVVVFGCDTVEDTDLDLIEVRWCDYGETNFDNGIPVANILRGQMLPSASIPQGQWTFLYKAKDTSGNYSANAARADLTVTADGYTLISTREDSPDWLGNLDGFIVSVSGALVPESSLPASSHTNAELFEQYVPYPVPVSTYTAPEIDKGIDGTVRVYGNIVSTLGRGVTTGVAMPGHQIDYKLAAGSYDGFDDWQISGANFRYLLSRIRSDNTLGAIRITGFETRLDALTRTEDGTYTTDASGTIAVTFTQAFHSAPGLTVSAQGSGNVSASYEGVTNTGFTGYFKSGGVAAAGTASYKATGA